MGIIDDINVMNRQYWKGKDGQPGILRSPVFSNQVQDIRTNVITGMTFSNAHGVSFGYSGGNNRGLTVLDNYSTHGYRGSYMGGTVTASLNPSHLKKVFKHHDFPKPPPEWYEKKEVPIIKAVVHDIDYRKDKDGCYTLDHSRKIMEEHK